jgi:hypothetical protein
MGSTSRGLVRVVARVARCASALCPIFPLCLRLCTDTVLVRRHWEIGQWEIGRWPRERSDPASEHFRKPVSVGPVASGPMVSLPAGLPVGWPAGWPVGWPAGWPAGWPTRPPARLPVCQPEHRASRAHRAYSAHIVNHAHHA